MRWCRKCSVICNECKKLPKIASFLTYFNYGKTMPGGTCFPICLTFKNKKRLACCRTQLNLGFSFCLLKHNTKNTKTKNFRASRTHLIWISQLCAGLCIIPIVLTHNLTIAIVFISLAVGFILSANGAYYAVNIDVAKERCGTALGVMDSCFALAGFVAPVITGFSVNYTQNFNAAFIVLTVLALSSVILVLCFHRPKENPRLS